MPIPTVTVLVPPAEGFPGLAVSDGIMYLLTGCCGASAKGSAMSSTGVCCRACYREVDAMTGWASLVSEPGAAADAAVTVSALRPTRLAVTEATVTAALAPCVCPDAFIVYPGEIVVDAAGVTTENGMRTYCPDCRKVTTA